MTITGERLKKLREEHGLSMYDLGKAVGVSKSSVFRWEQGDTPLDSAKNAHVQKLAEVLGTSVAYLKGKTDDPRRDSSIVRVGDDLIAIPGDGGAVVIAREKDRRTESSERMLLYALDILAMQNGFRIDYTPDGDVLLVNRAGIRREISEQDLRNVTQDLSELAGMSFRRLFGGQS